MDVSPAAAQRRSSADILANGTSEMGRFIASADWSGTSLGPIEAWPRSLLTIVHVLLASPVPMVLLWGEDGVMLYNDAYSAFAGGRHPGLLGARVREGWPEAAEFSDNAMRVGLAGGTLSFRDQELTLPRPGRPEQAWMNLDYSPVPGDDGVPAGVLCILSETTERVAAERHRDAAEAALRAERDRAQGVLDNMDEAFVLLDQDFRFVDMNVEAMRLESRPREALLGLTHWEAHPTAAPELGELYRRAMREHRAVALEHRYVWPDGRATWIAMRAYPVGDGLAVFYKDVTARKNTELALGDREQELQTLTDTVPVLISYVDAERRYRFINKVYEDWFPRRRDEILGRPVAEVVGPAAYAAVSPYMDRVLAGERLRFEQRMPYAETAHRHVEVEYVPRHGADGRVEGFYALVQDVSERKAAEAALRESEERFRNMADHAPVMMWVTDPSGHCTYLNARWYEFTGQVAGAGEGFGWLDAVHPEDRSTAETAFVSANAERRDFSVDFRLRRADGVYRWALDAGAPRTSDQGEPLGYVGSVIDIDERKGAEEALALRVIEQTAERNRVWEMSRDLFAIMGYDGRLKAINPAWETTLGVDHDALLSLPFPEQVHPDDHAKVEAVMEQLLRGESVARFEDRLRHADGSWRWISWALVPEGEVFYAVGRDVTAEREAADELEMAQEALRQSQKMEAMGQLTGGVAHDFNNLLTPIIGSLDGLLTRGVGSERERRLMAGALESAERAKTLVQRLLAFARRQPLQATAVNVGTLVQGMAGLMGSTLGPRIDVHVELAPDLPPARADAHQLEMALLNLAVNARDAMPEGGRLTVAAERESVRGRHRSGLKRGHFVRLSVADTGTGMDEGTLARAVEPFFSTKGVGRGTGLGLSMAHGLAAQLGGALSITSQPGQGTTVELWLPISAEPVVDEPHKRTAGGPAVASRGRALLVDDEDLVRLSTADMLATLGYDVIEAASAEDALRLLRQGGAIDLLVTDHLMPGMSGADLARQARTLRPGLPALIVSGYAEVEGIAPDLPRLVKPFRAAELAHQLAELMPSAAKPA